MPIRQGPGTRGLSDFGIAAGVHIVQDTFKGEQTADAIVIDNVLEHVAEPARMLDTAAASLNPGGLLIVITPNVDDIRAVFTCLAKATPLGTAGSY